MHCWHHVAICWLLSVHTLCYSSARLFLLRGRAVPVSVQLHWNRPLYFVQIRSFADAQHMQLCLQAAYEQVAQQLDPTTYPHGDISFALGILPLILSAYGPTANATTAGPANPHLNQSTSLRSISLGALNSTAAVLTDANYGLLWNDPATGTYYAPSWTDVRLNAWAAWLATQVNASSNDAVRGQILGCQNTSQYRVLMMAPISTPKMACYAIVSDSAVFHCENCVQHASHSRYR